MDRYSGLDLDCDEGGVAFPGKPFNMQKAALFGGMFKKSTKSPEAEDSPPVSSELSRSSDSLTDGSAKEKGGLFKGVFKKTTKAAKDGQPEESLSIQNPGLCVSSDNLTDSKSSKSGVFGGRLKRSPKLGHVRRPSQDLLDAEFTAGNDSLSENAATKEKGGVFSGMFKKSPKPYGARTQSQEDLSAAGELSGSKDSLSVTSKTKEAGGVFSGMFKKSPKAFGARTQSQEDLSAAGEPSGSTDNLSVNSNTKEAGGVFSGMFKKSPKAFGARTQSQEDLSAAGEPSGSTDNLSVNSNTKEAGGVFSGMFKKSPKAFGARTQSQDGLSEPGELSASNDDLSESTKEKGGIFGGVFKKKGAKFQSQDDLSVDSKLSASSDSLIEKPSKGGAAAKILKNPFASSSQDKEKTGDSREKTSAAEKPKAKQEKNSDSDSDEILDNGESRPGHKQSKFSEAMGKMNPFRSANRHEKQTSSDDEEESSGNKQKDTEDTETLKENEKQREEKPKPRERKNRSETTPLVPSRPNEEEMKRTSTHMEAVDNPSRADDRGLRAESAAGEANPPAGRATKVKKHKRHNPFMPNAAAEAQSDDEGLDEEEEEEEEEDPSSKEEKKEEEGKDNIQIKIKKPKRHNPFMPRNKGKVLQRNAQGGAAGDPENERSLFDRLEDFRVDPSHPEDRQDVENLMEWWNQVESWEDTPQDDDMTEKEEAKAFAVTAEKVQKGIRVFNKLFSERAEILWQHVIDLNGIADGLDKFSKNTKIAQITGGSTSAIGGVATITGLALAPVTMGISLIVTAVGLGVATAGGLTSAGAGISNQVNNSMDRKKVEKIVQDYQEKMVDLNKCLKFIKQGIENLKKFDLMKMKQNAYNRDFPVLSSSFYEDGAMAGKAILVNANEIMRVVQIANVAGSTAARAVQIASMATGVLTGLFVAMDIYFVAKDSKELKKGVKSEFAAKIRQVATQLHDGLVELNGIREELQTPSPDDGGGGGGEDPAAPTADGKEKEKYDSSSEDEIDRIKKAIKKDYENREYV